MQRLAYSNGYSVYEIDNQVWFIDSGVQWAYIARFVVALMAIIVLGNAIVQFWITPRLAVVFGIIAVVLSLVVVILKHVIATQLNRPPEQQTVLLIIDRDQQQALNADRQPVAPLAELQTERRWQMTSSSRALIVQWPGGEQVIAKGSPFGSSVRKIEAVLQAEIARSK